MFRSHRAPEGGGLFLMMDEMKRKARDAGKHVIDLSVGASDLPSPPEALATLQEAIQDPATHSYCLKGATAPFLEAAARWYEDRYGVRYDPASGEVLMLIGSQEGLGHALLACADHGDAVLMPDVAYPSYFGAVRIAGLETIYIPLLEASSSSSSSSANMPSSSSPSLSPPAKEGASPSLSPPPPIASTSTSSNTQPLPSDTSDPSTSSRLLPDLDAVDDASMLKAKRARVLLLNYPNNPTSATADEAFFSKAIDFCRRHNLLLIHDNPYVDQTYETDHAVSPLSIPGGRECCIELFSFSKSYHIAGFRLGFAMGNREALSALESVKAPIDFNQYLGIQRMGVTCLGLPRDNLRRDAATWQRRAEAMSAALRRSVPGWDVRAPQSCMYLWCKLPSGFDNDLEFCREILQMTGVALSPGRSFGPGGVGHVRFALVQPEGVLEEAARRIGEAVAEMRGQQG